ncbi:alpha/beta hydrolase family protein [Pleionea mediterranea]|uniref:Putative alpha/beta hydrolase n=1 Tax=Pleionea mediterranea TaxID=523701 RepID=A0A316FVR8_9GAMM|nr:alpha/beta fold hydrolase [Pleionea mediterranea]PWK51700.1 putative alpha/beta hydrolase [Pleionea mediterranea]
MSNSEQTASQTNISITAKDDQVLAATLFTPKLANGICIQINSAMAVTRGFYRTFAQYLAEQGFTVVTYDYRGIGDSYCKNWRNITLWQWGELDYPAITDWLSANYPDHRMIALGHSLGGQLQGLSSNNHQFMASLNVASGVGFWKHFPRRFQPKMLFAWYCLVPILTRVLGYMPGILLGGKSHIPGQVARQWGKWCTYPDYFCDEKGRPLKGHFHQQKKIRFIIMSDDHDLAPETAVEGLIKHYQNGQTEIERCVYQPEDFNVNKIGHFGFFSSKAPKALWQKTVDWMKAL